MYDFYINTYGGTTLSSEEFPELLARAEDKLRVYERSYRVTGEDAQRSMALCALAEAMSYFDAARNGEGGLRYASVGTVSVSGKGVYSQVDISPEAQARELYRIASTYLDIYRGTGG